MSNQAHLTSADIGGLSDINLSAAKICVWATYEERYPQAQTLLLRWHNLDIDEVMINEIGVFFMQIWQVKAQRAGEGGRAHCFLCLRKLPQVEGQLCACYKEARVGNYITDVHSLLDVARYKAAAPRQYRDHLVSTHVCSTPSCREEYSVTLGHVEDKLTELAQYTNPEPYAPPGVCRTCQNVKDERKWQDRKMRHDLDMARAGRPTPKLGDKVKPKQKERLQAVVVAGAEKGAAATLEAGVEKIEATQVLETLAGGDDPNETLVRATKHNRKRDRRREERNEDGGRKYPGLASATPVLDAAVADAVLASSDGMADLEEPSPEDRALVERVSDATIEALDRIANHVPGNNSADVQSGDSSHDHQLEAIGA